MHICHSSIFFGKSVQNFSPSIFLTEMFVFLLLKIESSLHIMNTSLFFNLFFANILSQSVAFLFILLTVTFEKQKFLFWWKPKSICSFTDGALGEILNKPKIIKKTPPGALVLLSQVTPCINRPQIKMSKQKKKKEANTGSIQRYYQKIKEKNE